MNDRLLPRPLRRRVPGGLASGRLLATAVSILLAALPAVLHAQAAICTVTSTGLAFGAYQPLSFAGKLQSVDRTSTATVSLSCVGVLSTGYKLSLGPGNYGGGNRISPRYLPNTSQVGDPMQFNVYTDAAYSSIWSDGVTAGPAFTGTIPTGISQRDHTAYGRIPAGQTTLKAGQYADTLTVTLSFNP
jgi:spore coat protein U-like protein